MTASIRVLVVDDSALVRQILTRALADDARMEVVGIARDGVEALLKAGELKPDVITLDIQMPELDGIEVLRRLPKHSDARVVVLSSVDDAATAYLALSLGAVDFVQKPAGIASSITKLSADLRVKIRAAFHVNPAHVAAAARQAMAALPTEPHRPAAGPRKAATSPTAKRIVVVGLAASTGGPPALEQVVSGLSADSGAAFVIVQHLPAGFSASFARRLSGRSDVEFVEAESGMAVEAGHGYVAKHGAHLTITAGRGGIRRFSYLDAPPIHGVRPSADPLFSSIADQFGSRSIGVVLTGMGGDAANGAVAIERAGGEVIVQDEATSVVWGMPRATQRAGATTSAYPLGDIAENIERAISERAAEGSD